MKSSTAADIMKKWSSSDLLLIVILLLLFFLFQSVNSLSLQFLLNPDIFLILKLYLLFLTIITLSLFISKNARITILVFSFLLVLYFRTFQSLFLYIILFPLMFIEGDSFWNTFSNIRKKVSIATFTIILISVLILILNRDLAYNFVVQQIEVPLKKFIYTFSYQIKDVYIQGVKDALRTMVDLGKLSPEEYYALLKAIKESPIQQIDTKQLVSAIIQKYFIYLYLMFIVIYANALDIMLKIFVGIPVSFIKYLKNKYTP